MRISRTRRVSDPPEAVWRTIGDPHQLARWWPKCLRVEGVGDAHFTEVLRTERGRDVRADYLVVEELPERRWHVRQELEGTPFEAVVSRSEKTVELQPAPEGGTLVTLTLERRLRGISRLGAPLLRGAVRRQVEGGLQNLGDLHDAGA